MNSSITLAGAFAPKKRSRFRVLWSATLALSGNSSCVSRQRTFAVAQLRNYRSGEFGTFQHREIGAFTRERKHEVRRVAEEGNAGQPLPMDADRQRINPPKHRRDTVLNEGRPK